jgi:hypothetical protein
MGVDGSLLGISVESDLDIIDSSLMDEEGLFLWIYFDFLF